MNIYVGNVSSTTTELQIRQAFERFGKVVSVKLVFDKLNGKLKGFGFVEMSEKKNAVTAISKLNGSKLNGRTIKVDEANTEPQSGNREGGNHYRSVY